MILTIWHLLALRSSTTPPLERLVSASIFSRSSRVRNIPRSIFEHFSASDPTVEHLFTHMATNFTHLSVILEHSAFVGPIQCQKGGLAVSFNTSQAFEFVKKSWTTSPRFVLFSHSAICTGESKGQREYWLVSSSTFLDATETASLKATELDLRDALHGANLSWGNYQPSRNTSAPFKDSKGAAATEYLHPKPGSNPSRKEAITRRQTGSLSCGSPNSSSINGLPTASCGPDFDLMLDNALDYMSFNGSNFSSSLQSLAPDLGDYNSSDYQLANLTNGSIPVRRHAAVERRFSFGDFFSGLTEAVVTVFQKAAEVISVSDLNNKGTF